MQAAKFPVPEGKLPVTRILGYGVGDFGFNLYFTTLNLFLLYYYTDVIGFSAATAGLIILAALVWDGITDPIMGYLAERTRTRWGSYRPYLLFGGPPLAASMMLMFHKPDLEGAALIAYAIITHLMVRTTYTIASIPYGALSARMSSNSMERNTLATVRMMAATASGLLIALVTLRLAAGLGGGDPARGFFWLAVMFSLLSLPVFLTVFWSASGYDTANPAGATPQAGPQSATLRDILGSIRSNRAFHIIVAAVFLAVIGSTFLTKTLVYYFKYNLGAPQMAGIALAIFTGTISVSLPIWSVLARRFSKRRVWMTGLMISIAAYLALYLSPVETPDVVIALVAIGAFGAAPGYLCIWSTLPDTIELGEWRSGVRTESTLFGAMQLVLKVSAGLAAGALGFVLDGIGYQANAEQSVATLAGLKAIMALTPVATGVCGLLLVSQYPIDQKLHSRLVRALAWRKARSMP